MKVAKISTTGFEETSMRTEFSSLGCCSALYHCNLLAAFLIKIVICHFMYEFLGLMILNSIEINCLRLLLIVKIIVFSLYLNSKHMNEYVYTWYRMMNICWYVHSKSRLRKIMITRILHSKCVSIVIYAMKETRFVDYPPEEVILYFCV